MLKISQKSRIICKKTNMKRNTHNINNNGSEANENFNNNKNRIENIEDKQKHMLWWVYHDIIYQKGEKAIYDKVISTAIQNINNGVGNEETLGSKKYTMVYKACNLNNVKHNKSSHKMISIRNQFMTAFLNMMLN